MYASSVRVHSLLLFFLLLVPLKVSGQSDRLSITLSLGRINSRSSFSEYLLYREAQIDFNIASTLKSQLPLSVAVHAGFWDGGELEFRRCGDICPEVSHRSYMLGVRAIQTISRSPGRVRLVFGYSDLIVRETTNGVTYSSNQISMIEGAIDVSVPLQRPLWATFSASRFVPLGSVSDPSVGHIMLKAGLTYSITD